MMLIKKKHVTNNELENPRVKKTHIFSHIFWTIHSNTKILDILKSQKIELNTSEKINWIEVPEAREKRVRKSPKSAG